MPRPRQPRLRGQCHPWDHDASAQKRWIPPPAAHVAVMQNRFNTPSIESKQPNT